MPDFFERLRNAVVGTYNGMSAAGQGVYEGAKDAFLLPRDVYQGKVNTDPRTMSDADFGRVLNLAGNMAGGGITTGSAPAGAVGMFAGRRSQTFPWDRAIAADIGETRGFSPDKIYENTGLYKGVDGKMRYEIPDNKAAFREDYMADVRDGLRDGQKVPLGQVIDHPELFKAYPQLADLPVIHQPGMQGASFARYTDGTPAYIKVDAAGSGTKAISDATPSPLSDLLHETQHAVQNIESFAPGTAPTDPVITKAQPIVALRDKYNDMLANGDAYARQAAKYDMVKAAHDTYTRAAGEVEARAVQRRQFYTDAERAGMPPLAEESYFAPPGAYRVPADQQWIPGKQLPYEVNQYNPELPFLAQYLR